MAVLDKETYMAKLKEKIGEDTSDDTLTFIEDASDTYDDLLRRSEGKEDWETKYKENDEAWRKRYRERFFSTPEDVKEEQKKNGKEDGEKRSFEDLFEEREG